MWKIAHIVHVEITASTLASSSGMSSAEAAIRHTRAGERGKPCLDTRTDLEDASFSGRDGAIAIGGKALVAHRKMASIPIHARH